MSRKYLITGGANSGKARWAISYFSHCSSVAFITSNSDMDEELKKRLEFSNEQNGVKWDVIRHDGTPADVITGEHAFYIFDGLPEYTLSVLGIQSDDDEVSKERAAQVKAKVIKDISDMIDKADSVGADIIIITLETGFSVVPPKPAQEEFRDILCSVNQRIANISDEVYLSVSGIQMQIK